LSNLLLIIKHFYHLILNIYHIGLCSQFYNEHGYIKF
jgi:hypothetical protein